MLRLHRLVQRSGAAAADSSTLVVGDLTLNLDTREVIRAGEDLQLTTTQFELLRFLMENPPPRGEQGADPEPGLGLRLRRAGQRGGTVHFLPSQEDRRRPSADDPHRPRCRLRHQTGKLTPASGSVSADPLLVTLEYILEYIPESLVTEANRADVRAPVENMVAVVFSAWVRSSSRDCLRSGS